MPSAEAVEVSIIATCCAVSFSYMLSGEPATIAGTIARTAPGEAASRLTVWEAVPDSASEALKLVPSGSAPGRETHRGIGAGRRDIVGGSVVRHRDGGVIKHRELTRDLARSRRGEAEHGDERTHAEDGAE